MQLIHLLQEKGQAFNLIMLLFTTLLIVCSVSVVSVKILLLHYYFWTFPTNKQKTENKPVFSEIMKLYSFQKI